MGTDKWVRTCAFRNGKARDISESARMRGARSSRALSTDATSIAAMNSIDYNAFLRCPLNFGHSVAKP
jgi:hypothetical protein